MNIADYVTEVGFLPGSFTYDNTTFIATWKLQQPIGTDKLLIDLDGDSTGVSDTAGNLLDGDWQNGVSSFPSGDGTPGGDLVFRFNVLPGDGTQSGKTDIFDAFQLRGKLQTMQSNPNYSHLFDFNGSGKIDIFDAFILREHLQQLLPEDEPILPSESEAESALLTLPTETLATAPAKESEFLAATLDEVSEPTPATTLRKEEPMVVAGNVAISNVIASRTVDAPQPSTATIYRNETVSFASSTTSALVTTGSANVALVLGATSPAAEAISLPTCSQFAASVSAAMGRTVTNIAAPIIMIRPVANKPLVETHQRALAGITEELHLRFPAQIQSVGDNKKTRINLREDLVGTNIYTNLSWRKSVDRVLEESNSFCFRPNIVL